MAVNNRTNIYITMQYHFIHVCLFATPWTVAHQIPLSMRFFSQEHWNWLPFPSPGVLSNSGIKPVSLMSPALAGGFFTTSASWEAQAPGKIKNILIPENFLSHHILLSEP